MLVSLGLRGICHRPAPSYPTLTIMMPHIVVFADQLTTNHFQMLQAGTAGWATIERCPQALPPQALADRIALADIVVGWAQPAHLRAGRTTLYLCGSAGLDAYIGQQLEAKPGFRICNAGGVMSESIAEHLLGLMLALNRQLPQILHQQAAHQWIRRWEARTLAGSTVCIVGLGGSGTELARRCQALDLRVTGVRRNASSGHPHCQTVWPVTELHQAVKEADHVVAVVPGGIHTHHLFNASIFAAMKPGSYFYSASRGSVTDETALQAALQAGQLGGAALDVFAQEPLPPDHPFWDMENVIVSPHSAGLSHLLPDRLCELFHRNLDRYHHGQPLLHEVNLATYATLPR